MIPLFSRLASAALLLLAIAVACFLGIAASMFLVAVVG